MDVSTVAATVAIELGSAAARPGETAEIVATLRADAGEEVAAVQVDLTFDPDDVAIAVNGDGRPDCEVAAAIDKPASGFGYRPSTCDAVNRQCERVRAVIVATDNRDPIPHGSLLYRCRVAVPFDARAGTHAIRARRASFAQPDGRDRAAAAIDGAVTVAGAPLDTPTPQPTIAPTATAERGGSGGGCSLQPQRTTSVPVFASGLLGVFLIALARRRQVNRRRRLDARWLIGFSCWMLVAASSVAEAAVRLEIDNVAAVPGESVVISVRLIADAGEPVAGTQNDLRFDPLVTSVAALEDGTPDCQVNPDINKLASVFGFQPRRCDPVLKECSAVRAIVLAFDNVDPIADGSVLYTCRLNVAADALPGEYPLTSTRTGYAPPPGGDRPALVGNGVVVVGAAPTTKVAPTSTPMPTQTAQTPGPTVPANDPADVNCDGRIDRDDHRAVVAMVFSRIATCNADCNRDGEVSGADLVCITYRGLNQSDPRTQLRSRFRLVRRTAPRPGR